MFSGDLAIGLLAVTVTTAVAVLANSGSSGLSSPDGRAEACGCSSGFASLAGVLLTLLTIRLKKISNKEHLVLNDNNNQCR